MARPIKETPVLKGKDAERFAERMATVGRASAKEIEEARKALRGIQSHQHLSDVIMDFEKFTFRQIEADTGINEKCGFHCLSDKDINEPTRAMYFDLMYYNSSVIFEQA